jgi:hypothetical protein
VNQDGLGKDPTIAVASGLFAVALSIENLQEFLLIGAPATRVRLRGGAPPFYERPHLIGKSQRSAWPFAAMIFLYNPEK